MPRRVTIFWRVFSSALSSELTMALLSKPQWPATSQDIPSYDKIHQKTYMWFGFYPCLWQIRVVEAILKHGRDIISVAATGTGKTLTFWMPLLAERRLLELWRRSWAHGFALYSHWVNRVRINDEAVVFESMSELQTVWICSVVAIQNAERPDNALRWHW